MTLPIAPIFNEQSLYDGLDTLTRRLERGALPVRETIYEALDTLNIPLNAARRSQIDMVAHLAETPHPGEFHNTNHFREVVACCAFLIKFVPLARDLKYLVLIAAAIHDLNHDGTSNKNRLGNHIPFRLEDIAYESAAPYLRQYGMHEIDLMRLHALLRATDVSKGPHDPAAPAERVRAGDTMPGLEMLHANSDLRMAALVLQAADIMPSSVLTSAFSQVCSERLERENGLKATPGNFAWFSDNIAQGALSHVPYVGDALALRAQGIKAAILAR